jgi:hypothetical protein
MFLDLIHRHTPGCLLKVTLQAHVENSHWGAIYEDFFARE